MEQYRVDRRQMFIYHNYSASAFTFFTITPKQIINKIKFQIKNPHTSQISIIFSIIFQLCSFFCYYIYFQDLHQQTQFISLPMSTQETAPLQDTIYKESRYRYVNFAIYILAALANSLPTQTFASINSIVSSNFNYSLILVTFNVLVFPVFHPIFAFPANWILDKFGMKIGCSIGGVLLLVGVWLRTLIKPNEIGWCLTGSIFAAIGNIFILNSPSILANNWFKPSSIPGIISFAVLANLISVTLGSGLPGLLVNDLNKNQEQVQKAVVNLLFIQAIIVTVPIVMMIFGLRAKPKIPPSKSAENQSNSQQTYSRTLRKLFSNREYLKLMLIMTLSYGGITSFLANLDQVIYTFNIPQSSKITGAIVLSAMFSGILSSFIFIRKVKTTLQYRGVLLICLGCTTIMFGILQFILIFNVPKFQIMQLYGAIIGACIGFFSIPTTSIIMAYSSEVVYPLGEGSATGYLFAGSQTFGFAIGMITAILLESQQDSKGVGWQLYTAIGMHFVFFAGSFVAGLTIKNVLNRTKYEMIENSIMTKQKQSEKDLVYSST